jgi:tetratricopeptide (TPR) repeat protein
MSIGAAGRDARPTGRNRLCPCGSGQKYKHCCGRLDPQTSRPPAAGAAGTHVNVGNSLARKGRWEEAALSYRRALTLEPGLAEAHHNLATLLLEAGRPEEALESSRRAIAARPDFAEAHENAAGALLQLGRIEAAIASYRRTVEICPAAVSAWHNLGNALAGLGRCDEALAAYRRAIDLDPNCAALTNNLGSLLRGWGRLDEAVACFQRALELEPGFVQALANLALAQRLQGRPLEAQASCLWALELEPGFASALITLAESHADTGDFAGAERYFRQAAASDGDSPEAWAGLSRVRPMTRQDSDWLDAARRILARPLTPRKEACLRYAVGKYHDDIGEFDHAFDNFRRANELTKITRPAYDPRSMTQMVDRIVGTEDRAWLARTRRAPAGSERAVFIVGMLRSGTTLAEQILASHPDVLGAGELPFWSSAAEEIRSAPDQAEGDRRLEKLGFEYVRMLAAQAGGARRVVDKMPGNFLSLGLIHAALPAARVIHLRRHPLDTCLSIYFQHLEATLSYTNDLRDLAHFYSDYVRVMAHWHSILPPRVVLDVPYEALVQDPEGWSRKMIDHIGLRWDPRCLEFHATARTVITASKYQVRRPITKSAVGRWKNYRAHVGPLLRPDICALMAESGT